jgi:hypothetical protein
MIISIQKTQTGMPFKKTPINKYIHIEDSMIAKISSSRDNASHATTLVIKLLNVLHIKLS